MSQTFGNTIKHWYLTNKRDLPWRETKDPFQIWLSEIILQQTQVSQGLAYYIKFIKAFPTIQSLAQASEEAVLKLWQGLGYYSRARNLHFTAKFITNELNGDFPSSYAELLKLKGVGHYTAAAIASFCFNEKVAVLDGNVFRVLARYFGIDSAINSTEGLKKFKALSQEVLPKTESDTYNQGIMEFGALQCKPKSPLCSECPLQSSCYSFKHNSQNHLPVKLKKTKVKSIKIDFYILENQSSVAIRKRINPGFWKNLYEFPSQNSEQSPNDFLKGLSPYQSSEAITHILSHRKITAHFHKVKFKKKDKAPADWLWIKLENIQDYPIHRLMDKFLESHPDFIE